MWDEFILTASNLSTLTASKAARGHTPYELWFGTHPSLTHLREIGCWAYVLINGNNPKITAKSVECVLVGYASNAKAYHCWHRERRWIVDSYHVTFVEHLNNQPRTLLPGTDASMAPCAEESVPTPTSPPQLTDSSANSPSLDGTALPPMPTCTGMTEAPRQSTWNRVPAPSREETNDGLCHGRETAQALEQVREASSWCAAAKVNAKSCPPPDSGEDDSPAETAEGPSPGGVTNEIVLLVDVEDPDAPSWSEALASSECNKWLEGAEANLPVCMRWGFINSYHALTSQATAASYMVNLSVG